MNQGLRKAESHLWERGMADSEYEADAGRGPSERLVES